MSAAEMREAVPAVFYIWRNEPGGEWVVSDPSTPYPANAIRAIPLPDDEGMVERVARAICVAQGVKPDEAIFSTGGTTLPTQGYMSWWQAKAHIARAALRAINGGKP